MNDRIKMNDDYLPLMESFLAGGSELFDEVLRSGMQSNAELAKKLIDDLFGSSPKAKGVIELNLDMSGEFRLRFYAKYRDGRKVEFGDIRPTRKTPKQH